MARKKILIGVSIALGTVLVTVLGLFAYLSYKIRDVKTPLIEYFKSQIDGDLKIGSADVVFIPAGINLSDVQLFAPGETQPSAAVKRAELRFNLLPLIQKKIETRVTVVEPEIILSRDKKGLSNMERIFAPLVSGTSKQAVSPVDQFWWKRLAVNKLRIEKAHFIARREGSAETTELRNVDVEADDIRFESASVPATIKIKYELPQFSREPMELKTRLAVDEARQTLKLQDGALHLGPAKIRLGGEAGLPTEQRKEVTLDLNFDSEPIDLKKFSKVLVEPLPASGELSLKGTVTGTAFAPVLTMILDSKSLSLSGKTLSDFHAELIKKEKPLQIKTASFGIYGGSVGITGQLLPGPSTSADLNLNLKSLSLAAISGSKTPARLSGNLQAASPNVNNPASFSGGGKVTLGPIPLPVVNLQNKVRVAEILAAGTALGKMVNLGMLSSSANVIGTQVDAIHATVRFAGNNITLSSFSLGNGHFSASGSGAIQQQKTINAGGTFNLNRSVTAQLIPDASLRQVMTKGSGALSVPFTMSGPLQDPNVSVDSSYLKGLAAKATAMGLTQLLAGGVRPADMLNSALKNAPLGNAKGPLGQILGGLAPPPSQQAAPTASAPRKNSTRPTTTQNKRRGSTTLDQLLFGR